MDKQYLLLCVIFVMYYYIAQLFYFKITFNFLINYNEVVILYFIPSCIVG